MKAEKIALVTGSSSGIGFETALLLSKSGFHTYATMRKLEDRGSKQIIDIAKNENESLKKLQWMK